MCVGASLLPCHNGTRQVLLHSPGPTVPPLHSLRGEFTLAASYRPLQRCHSALRGLLHSLSARNPVYQGCVGRGLRREALVLHVPALHYMCRGFPLPIIMQPSSACIALCGLYCILSLLAILSSRRASDKACFMSRWSSTLQLATVGAGLPAPALRYMVGSYLWPCRPSVFSAYQARFSLHCSLFLLRNASPNGWGRQYGPSQVSALHYLGTEHPILTAASSCASAL